LEKVERWKWPTIDRGERCEKGKEENDGMKRSWIRGEEINGWKKYNN
jgi:hypothetical protein